MGLTDVHHHLVYGIDGDGPRTREDMYAMLRLAAEDGVTTVYATPHVSPGVRFFDYPLYLARVEEANGWCRQNGLDLTVLPGAELLYTPLTGELLRNGNVPAMGGSRCALVEFLPAASLKEIREAVAALARSGFSAIIAHAERYPALVRNLEAAMALKREYRTLYQANAGLFIGSRGFCLNRFRKHAVTEGLIDLVASDAHNVHSRRVNLGEGYKRVAEGYGGEVAGRIFAVNGLGL